MSLYTSLDKYANGHKAKGSPRSDQRYRPTWGFCQGSVWLILVYVLL